MLSENEKEDLVGELSNTKNQIALIKDKLNAINRDKESWFSKKEEFHQKIIEKIGSVKGEKVKRNEFTALVKDFKEKRDELNNQIKEKVAALKKVEDEYAGLMNSLGIKEHPQEIKNRLERLEYKLETEPMSFDKEKTLMKEINKLRSAYNNLKDVKEIVEKEETLKNEIRQLRKDATTFHKQLQESAVKSQDHHEQLLESSEEIDGYKQNEEEAYNKFLELKQKFADANNELKNKLTRLKEIKDLLEENNIEVEEETKTKMKKILHDKEKEVEEKIKKTKKLTTEDLLILQAKEDIEQNDHRYRRRRKDSEEHGKEDQHQEIASSTKVDESSPAKTN